MSGGPVVIGVDIGGTSTRGRLVRSDELLAEASATTASISASGLERALATLRSLLAQLTERAGVRQVDAVCLGTAGSGSAAAAGALRGAVRAAVSTPSVTIVNDAELLLPAAGYDDGVAVVSGTGMKIVGKLGSHRATAGGWGFLLGDEGSGYWIVREALRVVLDRVDTAASIGELGTRLYEVLQIENAEQLIEQFHSAPAPAEWARHVPLVLSVDDPARATLLTEAAEQLARRTRQVLTRLGPTGDLPVVYAGGVLTGSTELADALTSALHRTHPDLQAITLSAPPVAGAVRLAQQAA